MIIRGAPFRFSDHRGYLTELWSAREWQEFSERAGLPEIRFVKQNVSTSFGHTIRGIHGDFKTWKLVACVEGEVFVAVVDCRDGPTFGEGSSWERTERNTVQVLVPPGHGLAHLVLGERATLWYAWSEEYDPALKDGGQFTFRWDDPRFRIKWPLKGGPILSKRDQLLDH